MKRALSLILVLTLLAAAIYWPVHHFGFVNFDDADYVGDNPAVQSAFTPMAIKAAFTSFAVGTWNPLLWFSFYTDQILFHARPGAMHVENVLLHLITSFLLWRLLFVATGQFYRSFIVAILFLCHPMHVESVAWISERKDVLSTPLLIGAMLAYVNYAKKAKGPARGGASDYLLLLCLFTLSLLTKSMGVTLPAVLLLMDYWPLHRWPARSWSILFIEKIPLFLLSILSVIISAIAQRTSGAISTLGALDLSTRIENALVCYVIYIAKLFYPTDLAVFYPHPMSRPFAATFAATGLLLLLTVIFYHLRNRQPYLLVGWFWFLGTLLPVIGLIQIGAQAMADRYSYFPSIGLSIAAIWWFCDLISNSALRLAAFAAVILSFTFTAHRQVTYWKDTESLFTHALAVTEDNFLPHDELGGVYFARHDVYHAIQQYQHVADTHRDPRAFHGLGNCYLGIDYSKSVFYYQQAVEMLPRSVNYRTDLAAALRLDGNLPEAEKQAQMAININPDYPPAHAELTNILSQLNHR